VASATASAIDALAEEIRRALETDLERPWCVHRLYEEVVSASGKFPLDDLLLKTELAANYLAQTGRARREGISALAIGVHCQDTLYWSLRAPQERLVDFGPEYDAPEVLNRLVRHFQCHGL
jgi:hypothetical protein